jgi:hypothetical protein
MMRRVPLNSPLSLLQQLSIKRTTKYSLKVLQGKTFKEYFGLGLRAKHYRHTNNFLVLSIW